MSVDSGPHDRGHAETVALYALQALPDGEAPAAAARIAGCADCRDEFDTLQAVVASFAAWPTDVLRPPSSVWTRLSERIVAEAGAPAPPPPPPSSPPPDWREVAPGILVKVLAIDPENGRVGMLVRLAPGTDYPPHRHADVEELHLLDGELMVDETKLVPGDHLRSEPGTLDLRVWSGTGCTCVLMASTRDAIL
jgi:anti-sigma factor ChrR (cupin superfamily)